MLNEDPDMVPKEVLLIVLDSKSDMCMAKNGKDKKNTRHIARRMHFVRNGEKCKIHKINWYTNEDIGKWFLYSLGKRFHVNFLGYVHWFMSI